MGDRRCQFDMAHALAPDLLQGDFHAALFADDALVLHPLVLAAQAFVILDRTEDAGAEQAIPLRLERAVVDRFRLLDFAERPGPDTFRRSDGDLKFVELLGRRGRPEDAHQFVHVYFSFKALNDACSLMSARQCA